MPGRRGREVAARVTVDKERQHDVSEQRTENCEQQLLDLKGLKRELQRQQSRGVALQS